MKRIKLTKNLYLDEYIDETTYKKYIHKPHYLLGLINPLLPQIDQVIRNRHGGITINNWFIGGDRQWSGLRIPISKYYSWLSQHGEFCNASDSLSADSTAEEIRQDIKDNYLEIYNPLGLTCIEDDVNWLHKDCRYHNFKGYNGTGLLIVPKP